MGWSGCIMPSSIEEAPINWVLMCSFSTVPDRELEEEKNPGTPRIRCPLFGWSPCEEDKMVLRVWQ